MKRTTQRTPPGLRCPDCGGGLKVIRTSHGVGYTSRRLECVACKARTNSVERLTCDALTPPGAISAGVAQVAIGQIVESAQFLAAFAGVNDHTPQNRR